MAAQLVALMRPVEVVTPAGVILGSAPAFDLNEPRVNRFVERVCRAVLHDAHDFGFVEGTCDWKPNLPMSDAPPDCKQRQVLDVFHYLVVSQADSKSVFWVILTFYRRFRILCKMTLKAQAELSH